MCGFSLILPSPPPFSSFEGESRMLNPDACLAFVLIGQSGGYFCGFPATTKYSRRSTSHVPLGQASGTGLSNLNVVRLQPVHEREKKQALAEGV